MKNVIQKLAGALVFIGLLVAVTYSVYVIYFSGEKIGDYQIKNGAAAMMTGGNVMSATERESGRFGPLALYPSMNLFRFTLAYSKRPNVAGTSTCSFDFVLKDSDGVTKWMSREVIHLRPDKKKDKDTSIPQKILENLIGWFFPSNRAVIGDLNIAAPGNYYLISSIGKGLGCMEIISASLQLRAHVIEFDWRVAAGGGGLFLLGLVLASTARAPKES